MRRNKINADVKNDVNNNVSSYMTWSSLALYNLKYNDAT